MWKRYWWLWALILIAVGMLSARVIGPPICDCRDDGGGGGGSGAPKFRWIRFLNHANKTVKRFTVKRILPSASTVWDYDSAGGPNPVAPFGTAGDWIEVSRALADPLANTRKLQVEVWIDVAGTATKLTLDSGSDMVDSGADNSLVQELVVSFDEHASVADRFEATIIAWHATGDQLAFAPVEASAVLKVP